MRKCMRGGIVCPLLRQRQHCPVPLQCILYHLTPKTVKMKPSNVDEGCWQVHCACGAPVLPRTLSMCVSKMLLQFAEGRLVHPRQYGVLLPRRLRHSGR